MNSINDNSINDEISEIWKNLPVNISTKLYYDKILDEIIEYILNKFELFEQKNINQDKSNIFCEFIISKRNSNEDFHINSFMECVILCRYGKRFIKSYKTFVNKDQNSGKITYCKTTDKSYNGFDNNYFKVIFESCIKKLLYFEKKNKNYKLIYTFKEVNLNTRPDAEYKYYDDIPSELFNELFKYIS